MKRNSPSNTKLAHRSTRTCSSCGRTLEPSELSLGAPPTCLVCISKSNEDWQHQYARILSTLAERVRISQKFANDRSVNYPVGLDYGLSRTLDSLRQYLVRMRITLACNDFNSEPTEVFEGHLRRYGPLDGQQDPFGLNDDLLGLFVNPDDPEPRSSLAGDDFRQIVQIEVIDPLLLGRHRAPLAVWTASDQQMVTFSELRKDSLRREKRRAKLFLIHLVVLIALWLILLILVILAYAKGDGWRTFGSLVNFCLGGFLSGMTLPMWETFPNLRLLWDDNLDE